MSAASVGITLGYFLIVLSPFVLVIIIIALVRKSEKSEKKRYLQREILSLLDESKTLDEAKEKIRALF